MAHPDGSGPEPRPANHDYGSLSKMPAQESVYQPSTIDALSGDENQDQGNSSARGFIRRVPRQVVPGLPRSQTLRRQQSERRDQLAPVAPSPDERRPVSMERRSNAVTTSPQPSELDFSYYTHGPSLDSMLYDDSNDMITTSPRSISPTFDDSLRGYRAPGADGSIRPQSFPTPTETHSLTPSQYDALIHDELERIWILNLSMHFRDHSKREKFFVTYRETEHSWRRVTISLDYRNAPPNSLETDLVRTRTQREKSAKIYDAIRESLPDIQFYETVTNLKLQTIDGRLHVHVVEDGNEVINFPPVNIVRHLKCRKIKEGDLIFDSHLSGFVYKMRVNGTTLIKKEIPSPDTVDEFLYEINALHALQFSPNVIRFYGIVVDDNEECIKGLLIAYAEQGALIDVICDNCKESRVGIPWSIREKWARQIVQGLADIHETGYVQGDFTLANVVIDTEGDAKIIDINRRGCPVGWEPPEATALLECNQRISLYIGVKSDLYQLGMVLWALAMEEDEPEIQGRPLMLGPEINVPDWYRRVTETCLSYDPRSRAHASLLLQMMPHVTSGHDDPYTSEVHPAGPSKPDHESHIPVIEGKPSLWLQRADNHVNKRPLTYDALFSARGRSPPSPMPSDTSRGRLSRGRRASRKALAALPDEDTVGSSVPIEMLQTRNMVPMLATDSWVNGHPSPRYEYVVPPSLSEGPDHSETAYPDGAETPKVARRFSESSVVAPRVYARHEEGGSSTGVLLDSFPQEPKASSSTDGSAYRMPHGQAYSTTSTDSHLPRTGKHHTVRVPLSEEVANNALEKQEQKDISTWISRVTTPDIDMGGARLPSSESGDAAQSSIKAARKAHFEEQIPTHSARSSFSNAHSCGRGVLNMPMSLAGIGALHSSLDEAITPELRYIDDEFNDFSNITRKDTLPSIYNNR